MSNFTSDPDGMASFYVETEVLRVDCGPRHSFSSARDFINIAPREFGKERRFFAHDAAGKPTLASKFLYRGSSRKTRNNGSTKRLGMPPS